jgi:predicted PurR-regulated permease PerM
MPPTTAAPTAHAPETAPPVEPATPAERHVREVRIDVPGWAIAKLVVGLMLLAFLSNLASQVRDVLVWTLAALFLAIALNPLVTRFESRLGRTGATLAVFGVFVAGLLAVVTALVAPFVTQVDVLTTSLPKALEDARSNDTFARLDARLHLVQHAKEHADALPGYLFGAAGSVLGGVVAATTVLFLALFLLIQLPQISELILGQLQASQRRHAIGIARHANRQIGGYVFGNLVISVICAAVTLVALYALGVPYSLALAVFMGIFDIIPLVGATIGSFVVIGAAFLFTGSTAGIAMFVIVMVYQQIENHVLQPIIYGRSVQLSPLTVMLAVLVGGAALGLIGALLAIPIAGTAQHVIGELLEERAKRIAGDAPSGAEAAHGA